jgi:hypothetical protein
MAWGVEDTWKELLFACLDIKEVIAPRVMEDSLQY